MVTGENELNEDEILKVSGGIYSGPCVIYMVREGDTLQSVALQFGTTVECLLKLNNMSTLPETLTPGRNLMVPYNR